MKAVKRCALTAALVFFAGAAGAATGEAKSTPSNRAQVATVAVAVAANGQSGLQPPARTVGWWPTASAGRSDSPLKSTATANALVALGMVALVGLIVMRRRSTD